jgi:signal peptidase
MAILAAIILAAASVLGAQLLGYKPMGILSGSMEPAYHVGGLVFIDTNASPEEVRVGDSIAYGVGEGMVVTHRVVAIDEGGRQFTTKGDANNADDPAQVPFGSMIGRAALHIPLAGYAMMNLSTPKGYAVEAIVIAVLIALFAIPYLFSKPAGAAAEAGGAGAKSDEGGGAKAGGAGSGETAESGPGDAGCIGETGAGGAGKPEAGTAGGGREGESGDS